MEVRRIEGTIRTALTKSAVDFLLGHGFQMDGKTFFSRYKDEGGLTINSAPFLRGVPYLSFEEESSVRAAAESQWHRNDYADISIEPDDGENLALMNRVRGKVDAWLQTTPVSHSCTISSLPIFQTYNTANDSKIGP